MANNNSKLPSFSTSINRLIYFFFGLALFLMYLAYVALQLPYAEINNALISRFVLTFFAFVTIYICSCILVVRKIKDMFQPLDRFAYGILNDEIHIYGEHDDIKALTDSLYRQIEKMENENQALILEQSDMQKRHQDSLEDMDKIDHSVDKALQHLFNLSKSSKKISDALFSIMEEQGHLQPLSSEISDKKMSLFDSSNDLSGLIKRAVGSSQDTKEDFERSKDAFDILQNMLKENNEFVEGLYSELSLLQSIAAQINLHSVNLSMEAVRSGFLNSTLSAGIEEMKTLSEKINERSDSIMLLLIRSKNANKLAFDQADFCLEKMQDSEESFAANSNALGEISYNVEDMMNKLQEITERLDLFSSKIYEINLYLEKENNELKHLANEERKLEIYLQNMHNTTKMR